MTMTDTEVAEIVRTNLTGFRCRCRPRSSSHVVEALTHDILALWRRQSPRETDAECERRLLDGEAADNLRLIDWIADKIGLPKNEELSRENFAQWLNARAGQRPFVACPGCDGHECDWVKGICRYPGAGEPQTGGR